MKKTIKPEIICYIIGGFVFLTGLMFSILGIVADHMSVNSILKKIQSGLSWRYVGLIIMAAAVIFVIIILLVNSKKIDRVTEKANRRKQRLSAMMSDAKLTNDTMVVSNGKVLKEEKIETVDNVTDIKDEDIKPINQ